MIDTQSARQTILANLQRSNHADDKASPKLKPQQKKLSQCDTAELGGLFIRILTAHRTTVVNLAALTELPAAVCNYLHSLALRPVVFGGNNPLLNSLDWSAHGLQWREQTFTDDGCAAIASADCGIADTGTVVVISSDHNPTRNNFLAEHHLVVINRQTILPYSEDVWEKLSQEYNPLPRAINFISGPSSSADVGLKLEYGAHGPRTLAVFLY